VTEAIQVSNALSEEDSVRRRGESGMSTLSVSDSIQLKLLHPRMANDSGTARILFYNSWKENCGKLQMHCSEFDP
jgi:hypothetical protein